MGVCDGEAVVRKWEEGNECSDSLRGNACSNGEFQRGGFQYTPAHARGRSPDPLAVGQPCGRRAPGLRSRHPHHASRGTLVKKSDANLSTNPNPLTVSLQGHVTPASVARKWARVRAIPWDCLPAGARGAQGRVGSGIRQLSLSMSEPPCGGLSWASGGEVSLRSEDPLEPAFKRRWGNTNCSKRQINDGPRRKPGLAVPSMHSAL